jgi:hypothetical protein
MLVVQVEEVALRTLPDQAAREAEDEQVVESEPCRGVDGHAGMGVERPRHGTGVIVRHWEGPAKRGLPLNRRRVARACLRAVRRSARLCAAPATVVEDQSEFGLRSGAFLTRS